MNVRVYVTSRMPWRLACLSEFASWLEQETDDELIMTWHDIFTLQSARILFFLTDRTPHPHQFARRKAMLRSPLFHFTVNRGPLVLVQFIAINTTILLAIFEEDAENIVLCLTDMLRVNIHVAQCTSKYCMLSETTENDWDTFP